MQVRLLLDLSGGVEEAQLINRRLLSLHSLWGHPTARGAVEGDDCGGINKTHAEDTSSHWYKHAEKMYLHRSNLITVKLHFVTGGKEAQKFSGAGSFHALLHTLQEPWTQLQGNTSITHARTFITALTWPKFLKCYLRHAQQSDKRLVLLVGAETAEDS